MTNAKDKIVSYITLFKEAQIPPDKIVESIETLLKTQSDIELKKTGIDEKKSKKWTKLIMLLISTSFILFPVILNESIFSTAIASLGAIGYATALYDTYGADAAKFGKSFRNFFIYKEDR